LPKNNRGRAKFEKNNFDNAINDFNKAIALKKTTPKLTIKSNAEDEIQKDTKMLNHFQKHCPLTRNLPSMNRGSCLDNAA
jgi:hypothetical protein